MTSATYILIAVGPRLQADAANRTTTQPKIAASDPTTLEV